MSQVLITIVDDDEPVRDATKRLVRSLGYVCLGR
jgi:FixJ family two-component response regulator